LRTICAGRNDVGAWRRRRKRSCLSVKIAGIRRRLSSYQSDGRRYLRRRLDLGPLPRLVLSKSPRPATHHHHHRIHRQSLYHLPPGPPQPDNAAVRLRVLHNCRLINQPPAGETQHPRPAVDARENPARARLGSFQKTHQFYFFCP